MKSIFGSAPRGDSINAGIENESDDGPEAQAIAEAPAEPKDVSAPRNADEIFINLHGGQLFQGGLAARCFALTSSQSS